MEDKVHDNDKKILPKYCGTIPYYRIDAPKAGKARISECFSVETTAFTSYIMYGLAAYLACKSRGVSHDKREISWAIMQHAKFINHMQRPFRDMGFQNTESCKNYKSSGLSSGRTIFFVTDAFLFLEACDSS